MNQRDVVLQVDGIDITGRLYLPGAGHRLRRDDEAAGAAIDRPEARRET